MKLIALIVSVLFIVSCSSQQKAVEVSGPSLPPVKATKACTDTSTCK